ncbi:lysophospholipase [Gammaproteobacteria bacterium]|nr:lysophospholipase [Gammaproteobacteria bacterium]
MAEHIGRYAWIIDKLNHDGFHVISKDHLGHGKYIKQGATAGFFNESDGWNSVTNNLGSTIYYAQNKYPNLPTFLLGHSMGSWIALSLLNKNLNIDGLKPITILYIKMAIPFSILHGGLHGHHLYHYLLQEYPMEEL